MDVPNRGKEEVINQGEFENWKMWKCENETTWTTRTTGTSQVSVPERSRRVKGEANRVPERSRGELGIETGR